MPLGFSPVVNDFSAAQWTVSDGDRITLNWNVANADSVDLYLGGANGEFLYAGRAADSFSFGWEMGYFPVPTQAGEHNAYTIVAKNGQGGYTEHRILVRYAPSETAAPTNNGLQINSFTTANVQLREAGMGGPDSTLLTWNVSGATQITIETYDNSPEQQPIILHRSQNATGTHTLNFYDLPTYMFTFYGLDELPLTLVATDAAGNSAEKSINVGHRRDTAITAFTVAPTFLQRGRDLTVSYGATWAYTAVILVENEYGNSILLASDDAPGGQPLPPQRSGRTYTFTWDQLTADGTFPIGKNLTITLDIGGETAKETITISD